MDTTIMEYTAEDLIAHKLQRGGILVAKPRFDREGADLLAFQTVNDGAKFCRIQCKGRSLINSKGSHVDVPKKYLSTGFLLFLFVETGQQEETHLFCFTSDDIRTNWHTHEDNYRLLISDSRLRTDFEAFAFNDQKIEQIKNIIKQTNIGQEMQKVIYGRAEVTLESATLSAYGTVREGNINSY